MYKTITSGDGIVFDRRLNAAEKEGFAPVAFSTLACGKEFLYSVVMHKPGTTPEPHMTTEQYLAVRSQVSCDKTANTVLKHLRLKGLVKDGASEKAKAVVKSICQPGSAPIGATLRAYGRSSKPYKSLADVVEAVINEEARRNGVGQ